MKRLSSPDMAAWFCSRLLCSLLLCQAGSAKRLSLGSTSSLDLPASTLVTSSAYAPQCQAALTGCLVTAPIRVWKASPRSCARKPIIGLMARVLLAASSASRLTSEAELSPAGAAVAAAGWVAGLVRGLAVRAGVALLAGALLALATAFFTVF